MVLKQRETPRSPTSRAGQFHVRPRQPAPQQSRRRAAPAREAQWTERTGLSAPGSGRSPQGIRHLLGCWEAGEADHAALRDRIGTSGAELLSEGTFGPAGKPLPSCSLGLASASPQSAATRVSTTTFVSRPRCPTCHQTPENLSDLLAVEPDGPPKLPLPAASTQPMPNAGEMPAETQSWPSCGACCDAWRPALTPLRVPTPSRELCPVLPRCALGSKPGLKTLGHRSFGKKWKRGHIFPGD